MALSCKGQPPDGGISLQIRRITGERNPLKKRVVPSPPASFFRINPVSNLDTSYNWRGGASSPTPPPFFISWHTTHTTTAERRDEKQCRRRGASSGQKTKRGIEGEEPAAAGIERFFFCRRRRICWAGYRAGVETIGEPIVFYQITETRKLHLVTLTTHPLCLFFFFRWAG